MLVFPDYEAMSAAAADWLAKAVRSAVVERGRFTACLCGGSTPPATYQRLAGADLPWDQVHLFWGDERWHGEPGNHYESVRELFSQAHLHPYPLDSAEPALAAELYEQRLREFFGHAPPRFDVALQGLGADGHTASLFPATPGLLETERWVTAHYVASKSRWRLTLTYPVLAAARNLVFLVSGAEKRDALAAVLRGEDFPATPLIHTPQTIIFCDRQAVAA